MSKQHGSLSINSENIFPIIKKWLYSDHDIFIRELVSNGCDAITKLKKLEMMGEAEIADDEELFSACESNGVSAVLECFKMLTESQRDVLNLYYVHHYSLKEISKLMNISEVTITGRWARGRAKLIEILQRRNLS